MALGLRQLRYFTAIVDAGALSRAAERLNVAQSALSHHVAEIEVTLGVRVFERRARGVVPTPAGRRLYDHACSLLSALDKAEQDVRTLNEVVSGPVGLGLCHTAISVIALDVMQSMRLQCPGVHLTLAEGLSPALVDRILSGNLDLALAYNPPKDSRLSSEILLEEEMFLVGHPEIIGRASGPIAFAKIPQKSVLGLNPVPASRAIIQPQILRNQIQPSETLEVDSLGALRKALEAGLGCAILARATVLSDLEEGRYRARRIVDPKLTRSLAIVALADRPHTRAFAETRKAIVDVVAAAVRDDRWPATASSKRPRAI